MTKLEKVAAAMKIIQEDGRILANDHLLTVSGSEIRVYDCHSEEGVDLPQGELVAYSEMQADFDLSLEEFVFDYVS